MWTPRRRKGFELAGTFKPSGLGLRKSSTARIKVLLAWREMAGPALSNLAEVSLARGLLDVVARMPEARGLIEPVLPVITAKIAGKLPELKIKRWRFSTAGDQATPMPAKSIEPLPEVQPAADRPLAKQRNRSSATLRPKETPDPHEQLERLEAVGRRYLERQARDLRNRSGR